MSKLPEHKKSAEELARLREELGIVHHGRHPADSPPPGAPATGPPAIPQPAAPAAQAQPVSQPPAEPQPVRGPKPVRSLKRSEREAPSRPVNLPASSGPSPKLPDHRHSPEEIADLRRREAIAALAEGGFTIPRQASTPLLVLSYSVALLGACAPMLMQLFGQIMASHEVAMALSEGYILLLAGCGGAIGLAAFIYLTRTQSRHHAAIIAAISVLAIFFSLLHFFPALKYGS